MPENSHGWLVWFFLFAVHSYRYGKVGTNKRCVPSASCFMLEFHAKCDILVRHFGLKFRTYIQFKPWYNHANFFEIFIILFFVLFFLSYKYLSFFLNLVFNAVWKKKPVTVWVHAFKIFENSEWLFWVLILINYFNVSLIYFYYYIIFLRRNVSLKFFRTPLPLTTHRYCSPCAC